MRKLHLLLLLLSSTSYGQFGWYLYYYVGPIDTSNFSWDTSEPDNLFWQYGDNQKSFFDGQTEFAGIPMLVTDTIQLYPDSLDAKVNLTLTRDNYGEAFVLSFDHKVEADTFHAGGYLEFNIDNDSIEYVQNGDTLMTYWLRYFLEPGQSSYFKYEMIDDWPPDGYKLIAQNGDTIMPYEQQGTYCWHEFEGYCDTLFDGSVGFTGTYNTWKSFYTELFFAEGGVKTFEEFDTLNVRFHFISDSSSSGKNGWAIKNIETGIAQHPVGSIDEYSNESFKVFPNPADDKIFIKRQDGLLKESIQLVIIDVNGRAVTTHKIASNSIVDLSGFSQGLYVYRIYDKRNTVLQSGKFVKQ